jgi:outer membrane receptor protein involved in Fe transport
MEGDPWEAGHMATGSPFVGVSTDQMRNQMILTGDFLVQLNHKINDFTGKMILGNSMYSNKYRRLREFNNSLVIPNLYNITNRLGEPGVEEEMRERTSIGLFADLTVGYKDFVFVHASARNDWDSRLTKENRSFFYPGVDASLVLSEAVPALKDNSFLSFAKIRGGWSKTGQISLDNWYATLPSFNAGLGNNGATGFPYGSLGGFQLATTLSNPLLKPELTTEIEAGFELSFIRNRFHVEANFYQSNTKDQTIPAEISYSTGYASAYINAGELQTSGIETQFKLTPVLSLGEFDWNLVVNYTYQTSEVLSIMPGLDQLLINDVSYAVVGQQFPALLVTDVKRDPEGNIIVDAATGYPIKDPAIKNMGHGTPNHILGITNSFSWKGLNLNAVAEYRGGNMICNWVGNSLDFTGTSWHSAQNGRQNFIIPNSVINRGTADAPDYQPNTNVVTRNAGRSFWTGSDYQSVQSTYLSSAAFWKLRELSISYNVPVQNILGGAIKDAEIGLVGRNLIMLRPKTNIWTDPEFNSRGGNDNAIGYTTVDQTPPTRIYGFSVKLTF